MNDNLLYELGSCKEIYLYGAGNIGKSVARFLMLLSQHINKRNTGYRLKK